ncbi:hypothetical protein B0H19DRAFT_1277317 [Mycena capillaripes]|nr:hypothetical protein B0H19DRAFT_1277317 [Mycena capillaripes]
MASSSASPNGEMGPEYERLLELARLNVRILEQQINKGPDKEPANSATAIKRDDPSTTFWNVYKIIADEYDKDFTDISRGELKNSLIFAGLFSAVVSAFVAFVETLFDGDIDLWLLTVLQFLLYLVLTGILAAALFAVLGQQYLMTYRSAIRKRGTIAERGVERQRKFNNFHKYGVPTLINIPPFLLQLSLLVFMTALFPLVITDIYFAFGTLIPPFLLHQYGLKSPVF